jgi:hypothetical protein
MYFQKKAIAVIAACVWGIAAHAQVLGNISALPLNSKVGQAVKITANIDVISGNYCGFVIGFGDGATQDGVSDRSHAMPFVVEHTYTKPGSYHVTLGGRNVENHPNCGGQEHAVDITVAEGDKPVKANTTAPVASPATATCPAGWKLDAKSKNAKTGAFRCKAQPSTPAPAAALACQGSLSFYHDAKKGEIGCRP